jgi:hypothetical protein
MNQGECLERANDAIHRGWRAADHDLRARWFHLADAWLETAKERRDRSDNKPVAGS